MQRTVSLISMAWRLLSIMRLLKKLCQCCVGTSLWDCLGTLSFLSLAASKFGGNLGQNSFPKLSQSAIRHNTDPVSIAISNDGQYSWPLHRTPVMVNECCFRDGTCTLAALRFPFRLGTLRSNDSDDNENVKKAIGLISKTTTSHVHRTFLYISFPFLHDYDVKMPNFAFYGGRKQATTIFYFSF